MNMGPYWYDSLVSGDTHQQPLSASAIVGSHIAAFLS